MFLSPSAASPSPLPSSTSSRLINGITDGTFFQLDWFHYCDDFKYCIHLQEYLFKEAMLWDNCNCQGPRKFVVLHLRFDKLTARRCQERGQTLPPTYQPPADEDWSTGIFGCTEDTDSCLTGLFCPCVLFGRNVENLNVDISQRAACVGHIICVEGGMTFAALTSVLNGIDP